MAFFVDFASDQVDKNNFDEELGVKVWGSGPGESQASGYDVCQFGPNDSGNKLG